MIDKDRFAALLADQLDADFLLLLTDVPALFEDWPAPAQRPIRSAASADLAKLELDRGTMGPKVEAAVRFVEAGGSRAVIASIEKIEAAIAGNAGTEIIIK